MIIRSHINELYVNMFNTGGGNVEPGSFSFTSRHDAVVDAEDHGAYAFTLTLNGMIDLREHFSETYQRRAAYDNHIDTQIKERKMGL